jgi:hypothetical protein
MIAEIGGKEDEKRSKRPKIRMRAGGFPRLSEFKKNFTV